MTLRFFMFVVAVALVAFGAEAAERIEGTTRCNIGPFMMEQRQCQCASDGIHFICDAIPRDPPAKPADKIEGTTKCKTGPFTIEPRECHCASDYKHFTCPEY